MMNYGLIMWLPFFLKIKLDLPEGIIAALAGIYDIGGVFGSVTLGWISDKVSDRLFIVIGTLIIPIPFLCIF